MGLTGADRSVGAAWETFVRRARTIERPDVEETLDAVSRLHAVRTESDAALFELAARFADLHSGDSLPRSRTVLPGVERDRPPSSFDLAAMAPADAYELRERMRQAVHLRTPADTFPFSSNTSRRVDIDHTEGYDAAPASRAERHWSTRMSNVGPLGRFGTGSRPTVGGHCGSPSTASSCGATRTDRSISSTTRAAGG